MDTTPDSLLQLSSYRSPITKTIPQDLSGPQTAENSDTGARKG